MWKALSDWLLAAGKRMRGTLQIAMRLAVMAIFFASLLARGTQVVVWSANYYGEGHVPIGLTNAVAIAAGGAHTLALTADGRVLAWGNNQFGQTNVPSGLSNVVAIAANGSNNLALTADGRVVGWGGNLFCTGAAPAFLTNIVAIAVGDYGNGYGIKSDGSVVGWYCDGSTYPSSNFPPELSNVVAVSYYAGYPLALRADGTVVAWNGPFRPVPPGLSNVVQVVAARNRGLGLTTDGRVTVWSNTGETNNPSTISNVVAIAAGLFFNLALRSDGIGFIWDISTTPTLPGPSPDPGSAFVSNAVAIATGGIHRVALLDPGGTQTAWKLPEPQVVTYGVVINLPTQRGRTYVLEFKSSLSNPIWTMQQLLAGDGSVRRFITPTNNQGFYRARRIP